MDSTPPSGSPDHLVLLEQWMETTRWLLERTERFPKRLRPTLVQRMEHHALGILEDVMSAGWTKDKGRSLRSASDRLNRLRVLVRLSHELRLLSHDHYGEAVERMGVSGRLLGGWMRHQGGEG